MSTAANALGYESGDALAKTLLMSQAEKEEIAQDLKDRIDTRRYWAYVDQQTGRISPVGDP